MWNYDGTNVNATISYVSLPWDSSVKCMQIYSSNWFYWVSLPTTLNSELFSANVDFTFWWFINATSFSNAHEFLYLENSGSPAPLISFSIRDADVFYEIRPNGDGFLDANLVDNTWCSIIYSYNNSTNTLTIYVNGVFVINKVFNQSYSIWWSSYRSYLARLSNNTLMSNFFLEKNVAWTQQDAQLFHNTFSYLYSIS